MDYFTSTTIATSASYFKKMSFICISIPTQKRAGSLNHDATIYRWRESLEDHLHRSFSESVDSRPPAKV